MKTSTQRLDRHQLKALFRAALKLDWRGTTNPFVGTRKTTTKVPGMLVLLILNFVLSIILGIMIVFLPNLFSGLVISAAGAMLIIAMQVLIEFGNIIITPTDYNVIAPHPVNSKTFYTAKLLHLLLYVSILSVTVSLVPAVISAFKLGSFVAVPVVLLHFWLCNVFVAFFVMNLYTLILKVIDRHRLERWLGYIHMVLLLSMYLGFNIIPRLARRFFSDIDIDSIVWLKLLPSYWFGSLMQLILDGWRWQYALYGLLGLLLMFLLGKVAVSYLSLTYAESLTKTGWVKVRARRRHVPDWLVRMWYRLSSYEDRALIKLVRANFKHDVQFRLGVVGFLPLILFYLVFSFVVAGTNVSDPFMPRPDTQAMTNIFIGMVAILSPFMMVPALQTSKEWAAAWVFYATPLDRAKIIMALQRFAWGLLVVPLSTIMIIVFSLLYHNLLHGLMHTIALMTVGVTGLTLMGIFSIRLPFAMEYSSANWSSLAVGPMLLSMIVLGIPIGIIGYYGYGSYLGWAIFTASVISINWLLGRGHKRRIEKAFASWEFTG